MIAVLERPATGRSLVDEHLFDRLVQRIMADHGQDRVTAERAMDQALVFLAACAENTGLPLSPSQRVDIGWHMFILFTQEYSEFCQRIAGRFLHHVPEDDSTVPTGHDRTADTLAALNATGLRVDDEMWTLAADCNQCYNGCSDSPKK
jgi:hypothetical protein